MRAYQVALFWGGLVLVTVWGILLLAGQTGQAKGSGQCSAPYYIDVTLPTQARWTMCWEERTAEGIILYDITYTPPGGPQRLVLAQANLAQLHVPYDDDSVRLNDLTDFGLGGWRLDRLTPEECPDGTLLEHEGDPILCQVVAQRGYAYKYGNSQLQGHTLTLFSVSKIGAYNYIVQWNFHDNGDIEPTMGATGNLQFYTTAENGEHGWPVNDDSQPYALSHTHNYYWRLDFDLVTPEDDLVEEISFTPAADRAKWSISRNELLTETGRPVDQEHFRSWRVKDKVITNSDGHAISYHLEPDALHVFRGPDYEPWTQSELYVTRYNPCEKWFTFNPTFNGCGESVVEFIDGESVDGADLVVWYGHSFHHLPRDEDEAHMHAHWNSFVISPRDWTAENPLVGVTPTAPTPTPLPSGAVVVLADFQAKWQNGSEVEVNWTTLSEVNNAYFSLLRSTTGLTYTEVATVSSRHPCENFTAITPEVYNFVDTGVISPTLYRYQLQYVGTPCNAQGVTTSKIANAWPGGPKVSLFPVIIK
jgi:primary-amine oxidase